MLVWIADRLTALWPGAAWAAQLASCTKITFRTALAALLPVFFGRAVGAVGYRLAANSVSRTTLRIVRRDCAAEQHKAATPTMGGLFLVAGIVIAAMLLCNWSNGYLPIVLVNLLAMAAIGAVDDLQKLSGRADGLRPKIKLAAQLVVAAVTSTCLFAIHRTIPGGTDLQIPLAATSIPLGIWFVPLAMLVIVGSSNAVNLTDGLDGLAGGCLLTATASVAVIAYVAGHAELASYLGMTHVAEAGETVIIAGAMIGGVLGFLWFNCHPAQVFMGDTGSLALGGTLGLLAVIARQELLLLIVGGVFVVEALSVIAQMASCRWRGKRILRCAPLHHHFQFLGWAENKIVTRFWIVSMLCALVGLGAMKMNVAERPADGSDHEIANSAADFFPATDLPVKLKPSERGL